MTVIDSLRGSRFTRENYVHNYEGEYMKRYRTTKTLFFYSNDGFIDDSHPVKDGLVSGQEYKEQLRSGEVILVRKGTVFNLTTSDEGIVLRRIKNKVPYVYFVDEKEFTKSCWFEKVI